MIYLDEPVAKKVFERISCDLKNATFLIRTNLVLIEKDKGNLGLLSNSLIKIQFCDEVEKMEAAAVISAYNEEDRTGEVIEETEGLTGR